MQRSAWRVLIRLLLPVLLRLVAQPLLAVAAQARLPVLPQQRKVSPAPKPSSGSLADGGMLQIRSGTHVAGFLPGKAYLVSRSHALTVEFLGTPGVMPRILAEQWTTASEAYFSQRVLYEDLWPGISLTFGLSPKGTCEATYVLVTGADVREIRLRYNVPVELQEDGTLKFRFSTGSVTESAPEAWQEIDGKRASVTVSFTLVRGAVGFTVGSYDPRLPLTIDPNYRLWSAAACCRLRPGQLADRWHLPAAPTESAREQARAGKSGGKPPHPKAPGTLRRKDPTQNGGQP